jgi:hypothetical protein
MLLILYIVQALTWREKTDKPLLKCIAINQSLLRSHFFFYIFRSTFIVMQAKPVR